MGRPQIAYLSSADPRDKREWSGIHFQIFRQLEKNIGDVHPLGPWEPKTLLRLLRARSTLTRKLTGKGYNYAHSRVLARAYGGHFTRKLRARKYDLIFATAASTELAFTSTELPVVYLSDATVLRLLNYYPGNFSNLSDSSADESVEIEKLALTKAHKLIYASDWAARSAIQDYRVPADRVHVLPFGANFEKPPDRHFALLPKRQPPYRLLFAGVDWKRKGGPLAWDAMKHLLSVGFPAELTVVGCVPPFAHPKMHVIPYLDKNDPRQAERFLELWKQSHAMLLPTRADCSPLVLSEASAFGIPAFATETGGVGEIVADGESGFLFPPLADGRAYAEKIVAVLGDAERYAQLRLNARMRYEEHLNWDSWGVACGEIIEASKLLTRSE
jgi:glycosyltransferase involved in cell wall biosynthesis